MFEYNDFILWELQKSDKIPLSYRTGRKCRGILGEDNRTSYAEAVKAAEKFEKNVGFVVTAAGPFFFVDIDAAYVDGVMRPECQAIVDLFKGAYVARSQSGTGIHIIGRMDKTKLPESYHCKHRPDDDSFDCIFFRDRFVALTGDVIDLGDGRDLTEKSLEFMEIHGMNKAGEEGAVRPEIWTTEPIEGGIESDTEIIDRACRARSVAAAFNEDKITFEDLWTNNVEALARVWPTKTVGEAYDASRADAAMAQHLAFWTGGNCEQMERIMRLSALRREKWDTREDYYLSRTIGRAVARQKEWYHLPPAYADEDDIEIIEILPRRASIDMENRFMTEQDQLRLFEGCVYVASVNEVMMPNGRMLDPASFKSYFGGHIFRMDQFGKMEMDAFKIFINSQLVRFPKMDDMFFDPSLPERAVVDNCINTYVPVDIEATEGDVGLFLRHVEKLLPDEGDRTILLDYLAACVQRPGDKFQWAPMIQGTEGNGKTLLAVALRNAVGRRYFHMQDPEDLANVFNSWLERAIIVCVEEVFVNRRHELSNRMKTMITNHDIPLHAKNKNQRSATNCAKFILMSNHKGGVLKYKNDRRYAVFFTAQQSMEDKRRDGMDKAYFKELYGWINSDEGKAALNWYLQHREITTDMMADAPVTTSTAEAIEMSLGVKEQLLLESIELEDIGFRGDMICTAQVDEAFKMAGIKGVSPRRRKEVLESIGYVSTGQKVRLHSTRGVLYVRDGSPVSTLQAQEIAEQFRILNDGP